MSRPNRFASYEGHLLRDTVNEITQHGMKISDLPKSEAVSEQTKLTISQEIKERIQADAEGLSIRDYQELKEY